MTGFAKDPMSSTGLQRSTNVIKGPGAPQLSGGRQGATTPQVATAAPATATPEGVQQVAGKMPQPGLPGPGKIYRPGEGPVTGQVSAQPPNIVPSPTHPFPAQADQPRAMPPAPFGPPHGYKQVMATVGDAAKAVAETMHSWKPAAFQHGPTVDLSDVSRSTRVDSKLSPGGDSSEFFRKRSETAEEMAEDMDMDASRHSEIFKLPRQRGRFARGYRTQGSRLLKKRSDLGGTVPQPATATAKTTPVAGDQDEDGEDLGMDLFMLGREVQSGLTLQDVLNKAAADRPLSPEFGHNAAPARRDLSPYTQQIRDNPQMMEQLQQLWRTGYDKLNPDEYNRGRGLTEIYGNRNGELSQDPWGVLREHLRSYAPQYGLPDDSAANEKVVSDLYAPMMDDLIDYSRLRHPPDQRVGPPPQDYTPASLDGSLPAAPPSPAASPDYFQPQGDLTNFLPSLDIQLQSPSGMPAPTPAQMQPSPQPGQQSSGGGSAYLDAAKQQGLSIRQDAQPYLEAAQDLPNYGDHYLDTAKNMGLEARDQAAPLIDGATQMPGELGSQYLDAAKQQGLNMRQDMQPYADAAKDLPNYGGHYLDTAKNMGLEARNQFQGARNAVNTGIGNAATQGYNAAAGATRGAGEYGGHYLDTAKNMGLEARNRAMQFFGLDPSNMSNQGPSQPQPQPQPSTQPPGSPSEQSFDLPEQLIAGEPPAPPPPVADESGYFGTKSPSSLANLEIPEVQLQMRPRSVEEAASQVAKQLPETAKPGLSQPQLPTAPPRLPKQPPLQQPSSARSWINSPPVPPGARAPKPAPANVAKVVSQPSQVPESFGPVGRAPANVGPFDHLIAKARQAGNMNEVQRLQGLTQDTQRHGQEWAQRDPTFNGRMDWYQQQSNNAAAGQPRFQGVAARPPMPKAPQLSSGNPIAGAPTPAKMPAPSMGSNHPAGPAKPSLPKAAGLGTSISNALQAGGQAIKRRAPALLQNDMVRDTAVGGSIGAASDLYNYTQGNDYHAHALAGAGLGLGRKPVSYLIGKAAPAVEPLVQKGRKWFQSPGMLEDALGNPISPLPSAAGATFTRGAQAAGNATRAAGRAAGNVAQAVAGSPVGSAIGSAAKGMARDTAMGGVLGGMTGGAMDLYNYASGNPYQGNAANMAGYGAMGGATAGVGRQAMRGLGASPEAQRFGASLMGVGGAAVPAGHAAMAEAKRQMADEGVRTAINVRTRLGGAQLTPEAQQEIANMAAQGDVAGAVDKVLEGVDPATVAKTEMGKALQDPATQQQMVTALFGDKAGALFGAIKAKVDAGDLQGAIQLGWGALPLPAKVAIAAGGVMGGYGLLKTFLGQSDGMAATLGGAGIAGLGLAGGLAHHANPEWFKSMAPESLQELFQAFQSPAAPAAPPPTAPAPAAKLPINAVDGPDTLARATGTLA